METNKNIMPEIKLIDPVARLEKIARFIGSRFQLCDDMPNTGAAATLDRELYDQNPNQMRLFDEGF